MTIDSHLRLKIFLLLICLFCTLAGSQKTQATTGDEWWDSGWSYRIALQVSETGTVSITLNFSELFDQLGIADSLLDLRSLRVIPYIDGIPGDPVPFDETFSQLVIDADEIIIDFPPDYMFWNILEESTTISIDNGLKTQGDGSLHAQTEISDTTQTITGFYYDFNDSSLGDWSDFEVLLYDIYPDVNEITNNDSIKLYSFKLEGLMNCPITYIEGPELAADSWNGINLPLQPFGLCNTPDYSSIDQMKFIFEKGGNPYLEIGDILDIWVDNFRMFDQDADGQIIWIVEESVDNYYLYFNLLGNEDTQIYLPLLFH